MKMYFILLHNIYYFNVSTFASVRWNNNTNSVKQDPN